MKVTVPSSTPRFDLEGIAVSVTKAIPSGTSFGKFGLTIVTKAKRLDEDAKKIPNSTYLRVDHRKLGKSHPS